MYAVVNIFKQDKQKLVKLAKEKEVSISGLVSAILSIVYGYERDLDCIYGDFDHIDWDKIAKKFPSKENTQVEWKKRTQILLEELEKIKNHSKRTNLRFGYDFLINRVKDKTPNWEDWMMMSMVAHLYGRGLVLVTESCLLVNRSISSGEFKFSQYGITIIVDNNYWPELKEKLRDWRKKK